MAKPLRGATVALVTSAGIGPAAEPPFDMGREKREPTWSDPSFRAIPRSAGITYPCGRPLGQVGDRDGQHRVLAAALAFLGEARNPGEVRHLPFVRPEAPKDAEWHPPEMSPIVKSFIDQIRAARK
jgi:hypothetical protein